MNQKSMRIQVSDDLDALIVDFQEAYKLLYGRGISKATVAVLMMRTGQKVAQARAADMRNRAAQKMRLQAKQIIENGN